MTISQKTVWNGCHILGAGVYGNTRMSCQVYQNNEPVLFQRRSTSSKLFSDVGSSMKSQLKNALKKYVRPKTNNKYLIVVV